MDDEWRCGNALGLGWLASSWTMRGSGAGEAFAQRLRNNLIEL